MCRPLGSWHCCQSCPHIQLQRWGCQDLNSCSQNICESGALPTELNRDGLSICKKFQKDNLIMCPKKCTKYSQIWNLRMLIKNVLKISVIALWIAVKIILEYCRISKITSRCGRAVSLIWGSCLYNFTPASGSLNRFCSFQKIYLHISMNIINLYFQCMRSFSTSCFRPVCTQSREPNRLL